MSEVSLNEPLKSVQYCNQSCTVTQNEASTSTCVEESLTPCLIENIQKTKHHKWLMIPKTKDFDTKVKIDGKTFSIKRNMLVSQSTLFEKLLPQDEESVVLTLSGVSKFNFEIIKDWMKGKKKVINKNNAVQLMDVAKKLEMRNLIRECKQLIREQGGQDDGSDSWDYQLFNDLNDKKKDVRKRKEDELTQLKIKSKEDKKKLKEALKLERKKEKEEEKQKKIEEKTKKKEKKLEEKRKKEMEKNLDKKSADSSRSKFSFHKAGSSLQRVKDDVQTISTSSGPSTSLSRSSESTTAGSKTTAKSLNEEKKTKKKFIHKIQKYPKV